MSWSPSCRQFGVVADLRMGIQGQVGRVEAAAAQDERPHPPEKRPHQPLRLLPEEAVVDDEQLGLFGHGAVKGLLAGVHGEGHFPDLRRPLHLQAVLRRVLYLPHAQVFVQVGDQFMAVHRVSLEAKIISFYLFSPARTD